MKKLQVITLPIEALEGLITVIKPHCYIHSQKVKFVEVNLRFVLPVPADEEDAGEE